MIHTTDNGKNCGDWNALQFMVGLRILDFSLSASVRFGVDVTNNN